MSAIRITKTRTKSKVRIAVPVETAFAWFEDPQSMLTLPSCVAADGKIGPNGSGFLRFEYPGLIVVNDWNVLEYERHRRTVIHQSIRERRYGQSKLVCYETTETNTYRPRRSTSVLVRTTVTEFTEPTYINIPPWLYRLKKQRHDRQTLEALARGLAPDALRLAERVPGPPIGPYLTDQNDEES